MKDLRTVADYENRRKLEIFRGQCFNNACVLMTVIKLEKFVKDTEVFEFVFNLAEKLYEAGINADYLQLKGDEDDRGLYIDFLRDEDDVLIYKNKRRYSSLKNNKKSKKEWFPEFDDS